MTLESVGIEPFDPTANYADQADDFVDDDRTDDDLEPDAPTLAALQDGGDDNG
jgi:hypothetical protein